MVVTVRRQVFCRIVGRLNEVGVVCALRDIVPPEAVEVAPVGREGARRAERPRGGAREAARAAPMGRSCRVYGDANGAAASNQP